jgi:hypothetical protein
VADFGRCEHGALPDVCFKCARRSGLLLSRKMTERLKPMTDAVDEATRLRGALAEALRENCCDSCVGTGLPTNGSPCMCGGTGKMSDAAQYLRVQLVTALRAWDEEMLRLKACEHIAEGEDGWQRLRNECPSTAAVAVLRAERDALRAAIEPTDKNVEWLTELLIGGFPGKLAEDGARDIFAEIAARAKGEG